MLSVNMHVREGILDFAPETEKHVLDGGSLFRRILGLWRKWESYGAIAQSYADFTVRRYGAGTTVVFDGLSKGHPLRATHRWGEDRICIQLSDSLPVIRFTANRRRWHRNSESCSGDISFTHNYANRRHQSPGFTASLSCKATLEESLLQIRQDNRKCQSGEHQLSEGSDRE